MKTVLFRPVAAALAACAGLCLAQPLAAALSVAPIFTTHMVLQRNTSVPVFGTDTAGLIVTVQFNGQNVTATTDASGKWKANLASMVATTAPTTMTVSSADGAV